MALALYRKYRPATFAEVVGQEHVTDPLRTALAAGRVNHAYLFSGPRGCGKTSSARILARSLNCVQGPTDEPCGKCDSCKALAPEGPGSVDVVELDAASHGGVDDARELRDRAFFTPAESRYRVFIIDEAHMVTPQGFNALLKIVEEPPEHLIFIFATTEPDKVLTTIRSRTHHYPFRLIPPPAMRELLERNCAAEGVPVEPAVFPLVVRSGGGSARDTQSILDQLLAGAGPDGITYERAVALLGVTDAALIDDMVDGLAAEDGSAVFGTVDKLVDAGHDPRRFASDLLDRLRDLVLLRSVPDAAQRGLVAAPDDELTRMHAQVERLGLATLSRYADIVHTGLTEMRGATAPRLLLELLCARMLLPAADESQAAMLQRLERLERRVTAAPAAAEPADAQQAQPLQAGAPAEAQQAAAPQAPAPQTPARQEPAEPRFERPSRREPDRAAERAPASQEPEQARSAAPRQPDPAQPAAAEPRPEPSAGSSGTPGAMDATGIRRVWSELLGAIRKTSRSTEAMLSNATVHSVEGNTVVLTHTAAPLARRLSEARNVDVIASALYEVLGGEWQVRCIPADEAGAATQKQARRQPSPKQPQQSQSQSAQSQSAQSQQKQSEHEQVQQQRGATQQPDPRPQQQAAPARQEPPDRPASPPADDIPLPPEPEPDDYDAALEPPPGRVLTGGSGIGDAAAEQGGPQVSAEPDVQRLLSDQLGARPLDEA